jgi:uncharacterized membrane protein
VHYNDVIEDVGKVIDGVGVGVMVVGIVAAASITARRSLAARRSLSRREPAYNDFRQRLGRAILLGLELLVAGDIIRTVAATPTLTSVGVLAGIVAIRTFLSFSLEVEISGRWPWQKRAVGDSQAG